MKNPKLLLLAVLGICLIAAAQTTYADVGFDNFNIDLSTDQIDTGGSFNVNLNFIEPDTTESVTFKLVIKVDGETVFQDKTYDVSFTKNVNKTVTISSGSFDLFEENLMNYQCGDVDVDVEISGGDLSDDDSDSASLEIVGDKGDLTFDISPDNPGTDEDITVTVYDEDDEKVSGANVKVTWVDDPDGETSGEWDTDDATWKGKTNTKGKAVFNLGEEFDNPAGDFQVDVYAADYCLSRDTIATAEKNLTITLTPSTIITGGSTSVCVTGSDGALIRGSSVSVQGPGYSKAFQTGINGCVSINIIGTGKFTISATSSGYSNPAESTLTVTVKPTTTTTTTTTTIATTTTSTSTTEPETTTSTTEPEETTTTKPSVTTTTLAAQPSGQDNGLLMLFGGIIVLLMIITVALVIVVRSKSKNTGKK